MSFPNHVLILGFIGTLDSQTELDRLSYSIPPCPQPQPHSRPHSHCHFQSRSHFQSHANSLASASASAPATATAIATAHPSVPLPALDPLNPFNAQALAANPHHSISLRASGFEVFGAFGGFGGFGGGEAFDDGNSLGSPAFQSWGGFEFAATALNLGDSDFGSRSAGASLPHGQINFTQTSLQTTAPPSFFTPLNALTADNVNTSAFASNTSQNYPLALQNTPVPRSIHVIEDNEHDDHDEHGRILVNSLLDDMPPAIPSKKRSRTAAALDEPAGPSTHKRSRSQSAKASTSARPTGAKGTGRKSARLAQPVVIPDSDDVDIFALDDDELTLLDLTKNNKIPEELMVAKEDNSTKLVQFECVICMDSASNLTVTHCGMLPLLPAATCRPLERTPTDRHTSQVICFAASVYTRPCIPRSPRGSALCVEPRSISKNRYRLRAPRSPNPSHSFNSR